MCSWYAFLITEFLANVLCFNSTAIKQAALGKLLNGLFVIPSNDFKQQCIKQYLKVSDINLLRLIAISLSI